MTENRPNDSFDAIVDQVADKLASTLTGVVQRVADRTTGVQSGNAAPSKNIIVKPSVARDGRGITIAGAGIIGLGLITGFGALFTSIFSSSLSTFTAAAAGVFILGGVVLCLWGSRERGLARSLQNIATAMASRLSITLEELSAKAALPVNKLRALLKKSIKRGYIPQGHLATVGGRETLFLTDGAYQDYLAAERDYNERMRAQAAEQAAQSARDAQLPEDAKAAITACRGFMDRISSASLKVSNAETRGEVAELNEKVARVANHVRNHPEDAARLDRYVDYYLPTTAKLVESYAELDALQADGENADAARREVDETVTLVSNATDKLLDDLVRDTHWDVSSDAKVMRTMLHQDGLVDDENQ